MKAGVLIAGSLAWDPSTLRSDWRRHRLSMVEATRVRAPLRYGRSSSSRDDTYTMVFSSSARDLGGPSGVGLAVPFRRPMSKPSDLIAEAEHLWGAERNSEATSRGVISASWGSVGLLLNPGSTIDAAYLREWKTLVRDSPKYGGLVTTRGEQAVLDPATGFGTFGWPETLEEGRALELDALLFTATSPTLTNGEYPPARLIAAAWNKHSERSEYFWRNRSVGIETEDDAEIESLLRPSARDRSGAGSTGHRLARGVFKVLFMVGLFTCWVYLGAWTIVAVILLPIVLIGLQLIGLISVDLLRFRWRSGGWGR